MIRYKFSTKEVSDALIDVIARFPFVVIASVFGAVLGIMFFESAQQNHELEHFAIGIMACSLAVPFLISLKLFTESRGWSRVSDLILQLVGVGLIVLYWYFLPDKFEESPYSHWYRYAALWFAAHLLVSFAPFIKNGHNTEFWDYNQNLFFRWLIGALYAAVLFGGVAAGMGAVDALFDVSIAPERYGELWMLCAAIFHPLFFLSGVPKSFVEHDDALNYPKMLRWFCVYILVPIVIIYLAILYAYFGKIGIEWKFPRGYVSYLGLGFSVVGMLALLLVYPMRVRDDQPFIRLYYRWYFVALIPVVALLFLAIGKRLSQYGFTEERYIVFILTIWLALVTIYFIFISRHRIKTIPITLFVIALLSAWIMFPISRASQTSRLKNFLRQEKMLDENGKIIKATKEIGDSANYEISNIIKYISEVHSPKALQPLYVQSIDSLLKDVKFYNRDNALVEAIGLKYQPYKANETAPFSYSRNKSKPIEIDGYEIITEISDYGYSANTESADTVLVAGEMFRIKTWDSIPNSVIELPNRTLDTIEVRNFVKNIFQKYTEPPDSVMQIVSSKGNYKLKLIFNNLNGYVENGEYLVTGYDANLLIGLKE